MRNVCFFNFICIYESLRLWSLSCLLCHNSNRLLRKHKLHLLLRRHILFGEIFPLLELVLQLGSYFCVNYLP